MVLLGVGDYRYSLYTHRFVQKESCGDPEGPLGAQFI